MAERGFVDVRWIGGPYDGSAQALPVGYLGAAFVDMPDLATATNTDASTEPAIFTGPHHRYALTRDEDGLTAEHVPGASF